jgi:hypothetical protein
MRDAAEPPADAAQARDPAIPATQGPPPATGGPWWPTFWVLAGLALAVLATTLLTESWPWNARALENGVVSLQMVVTFAYLIGAHQWLRVRAASASRALSTPRAALGEHADRTGVRVALLLGAGTGVLGPWLADPWQASIFGPWQVGDWSPVITWHRLLALSIGVAFALFGNAIVQVSRRLSRLAMADAAIDAFDARRQRPFVQQGLTNGGLVTGFLCLISLFVIDHGANPMLLAIAASGAVLTVVAVLLPMRGVRSKIRLAKTELLLACDAEIEAFGEALRGGRAGPVAGRIADVVALRGHVERLREWPFDTSAIRRVVVYLLLPLLTWLLTVAMQPWVESWLGKN